ILRIPPARPRAGRDYDANQVSLPEHGGLRVAADPGAHHRGRIVIRDHGSRASHSVAAGVGFARSCRRTRNGCRLVALVLVANAIALAARAGTVTGRVVDERQRTPVESADVAIETLRIVART